MYDKFMSDGIMYIFYDYGYEFFLHFRFEVKVNRFLESYKPGIVVRVYNKMSFH